MAVVGKKLDYNDYKDNPKSDLSKFNAYRDPSKREAGPEYHDYGMSQAEKIVNSLGGKK